MPGRGVDLKGVWGQTAGGEKARKKGGSLVQATEDEGGKICVWPCGGERER